MPNKITQMPNYSALENQQNNPNIKLSWNDCREGRGTLESQSAILRIKRTARKRSRNKQNNKWKTANQPAVSTTNRQTRTPSPPKHGRTTQERTHKRQTAIEEQIIDQKPKPREVSKPELFVRLLETRSQRRNCDPLAETIPVDLSDGRQTAGIAGRAAGIMCVSVGEASGTEIGEGIEVAKLVKVSWFNIKGNFRTINLSPGTLYEIVFEVKKFVGQFNSDFNFDLIIKPQHSKALTHTESLEGKPLEKWFELVVGEFRMSPEYVGNMEFGVKKHDIYWKSGVVVKCAIIRPKKQPHEIWDAIEIYA
ncbi:hypothetical protein C3L33_18333, partial [Rhododendron williamsianum]